MVKVAISMMFVLALGIGCKDKEQSTSGQPVADTPKLEMSSDSPACKKAMSCCTAMVKAQTGTTTPEDVNLKCSGVALAKTDEECGQFQQGYAMSLEAEGKPVPAECK